MDGAAAAGYVTPYYSGGDLEKWLQGQTNDAGVLSGVAQRSFETMKEQVRIRTTRAAFEFPTPSDFANGGACILPVFKTKSLSRIRDQAETTVVALLQFE